MTYLAEGAVAWHDVLEVLWVSAASGIGVTAAFAVALLGATKAVDLRRIGHTGAASVYAALMVVAGGAVTAAVVYGVIVMTQKS
jgi:acetyl-CoA acetyltransferase